MDVNEVPVVAGADVHIKCQAISALPLRYLTAELDERV